MELETLEVLLDINTERVNMALERALPQIEGFMNRIQQVSGNSMDRTEKNMDIEKGASNFTKQLEKMNQSLEKTLTNFERSSKKTSESVGDNFSTGVRKARPKVTKEIDAMVNEINAKMGQAKAAQEKVAYLKSQRQTASSQGDTGKVVKYDEQIARAQAQMTKFRDQAKGLGGTIKRELDSVPSSLDHITKGMSQNEAKIEAMRKRIRTLKAEYNDQRVPTGSFTSGFKNYKDSPQSLKTSAEIEKQSLKMNKLISSNDQLQKEYAQTEDRAEALRKALLRVNTALGQSSIQTGSASSGATMTGTGLKQSERAVSKYGGVFSRMSNAVSHGFGNLGNGLKGSLGVIGKFGSLFSSNSNKVVSGSNRMTGSTNAFGQSMKYLLPSLVVYQLIGGAISKLASGMMSALKTNDQFSNSLNQIKVNLLTAFYPIYTAIMPAINTLMNALAQITGQFASFIAMLFGTTYDAAKQGASGLYDNVQALNDTGSSASKAKEKVDKLQRSLMGFDEINKLNPPTDDEDDLDDTTAEKPSVDFGSALGSYSVPKWMKDIQNLLKDFFKPFKDAWNNQGKRVIDAWKYALREIIGLAKAIGKSFMEVWTNGTGQRFIENILILLADILYIIGDIARAFRIAWEENNRGTKLIQQIFDALNQWLEVLHDIAQSFRDVWNNGTGVEVARQLLDLFTNLFHLIETVGQAFQNAWNDGGRGTAIIQSIFNAFVEILNLINSITTSFDNAFASGIGESILANIMEIITNIYNTVGNLAKSFREAWDENQRGQTIFEDILKVIDIVLETINEMTDATAVWADTLDFRPLLNSIDRLLKSIQPLTKNIGEGLKWFYENVLLPLASYTIEDLIPAFLDTLSGALDFLNGVIDGLKPLFSWLWDDMLKPIAEWTGGVIVDVLESLSDVLSKLGKWISKHSEAFSNFVVIVGSFGVALGVVNGAITAWNVVAGIGAILVDAWAIASGAAVVPTTALGGAIAFLMSPLGLVVIAIAAAIAVGVLLWKNWDTIKTKAAELGAWISEKWDGIKKATSEAWESVKKWTSEKWNSAKDTVTEKAGNIASSVRKNWDGIKTKTSETWDNFKTKVSESANTAKENASTKIDELKNGISERWSNIKESTKNAWDNIKENVSSKAGTAKEKASTAFSNLKNNMSGSFDTMKKNASETFDKITGWATSLGDKIGKGLTGGVEAVKKGAGKIFHGMVDVIGNGVNGVISGINWVLEKVGASGSKLKPWDIKSVPGYAQGTGHHPGGLALVNDGLGSNYREAFRTPDGRTGIFPAQRNLMVNLPAGSSVLSGPKTAATYGVPAYAGGIGDWLNEKWNGAKEIASDVWSYASNPKKLLNAAVSKFVNLKDAVEPALSMAKGSVGTIAEGAYNWVKSKFDAGYESQNSTFDGSMGGWGVYKYLYDIAQKTIDKYPGMRITSGYREGDPYSHGKHQAIDIAYPASMNGSSQYMAPANWVFDNFASKVAYVITQGKVRDRTKMSGTDSNSSWVGWPDNDHYDHLHINGSLGAKDIQVKGDNDILANGGATGGWASQVKKAAKMLNQSLSNSELNGILAQIQRESSGNQNAIQNSAVWDVNTASGNPAKGLLQYISQTFNAYKLRGYENIFNGFHQLLAFFNNSNWRRDLPYGKSGWGPSGGRIVGYENGGLVDQDGLYRMGEGNKKEMVIPLEKPKRAAELIQQAIEYLGLDMFGSTITLPEMFQAPTFTTTNSTFSNNEQMNYQGGGIQDFTSSMVNTLMNAISAMGATPTQATNGDIVINIGGKEFGRIAVKEINKYHQQLGYNELNI